jgi:hypothetical protein
MSWLSSSNQGGCPLYVVARNGKTAVPWFLRGLEIAELGTASLHPFCSLCTSIGVVGHR